MRSLLATCVALIVLMSGEAQAAPRWIISPSGIGPLKIGMTVEQAAASIDTTLNLTDDDVTDDADICAQIPVVGYHGLYLLFEHRHLSSVIISSPSEVTTEKGIGIGSSQTLVKAAYGHLKMEPADFGEAPAQNLTWWMKADMSGIRFKTDIHRKVQFIAAGNQSIKYTEGCL